MNTLSLFDSLFNNQFNTDYEPFNYHVFYSPKVDVSETGNAYNLEMELPGLTQNDVNLELDGSKLTNATKKIEKNAKKDSGNNEEKTKYLIKERREMQFSRSFTLPEDVDSEKISANFKNGILSVSIPRKEQSVPRKIAIEAK